MSDSAEKVSLNIKGPSELKLTLTISTDQTILQLKQKIQSEKSDFPADAQRLIYAGKVLKDEELLSTYKIKNGHTIHMVRSASRSAPSTGNSQTNSPASSAAQGVPSNFSAGQTFTNNPLSALNRADYAGPHMARLLNESGGIFGGMGVNPRDPNMMMNALQNPEVQRSMRDMMARPEFIDQIISLNPQLQSMAPQMREMMRSEQFRELVTNPESMQRMAQMQQMMGGGGFGGLGRFGAGAAGGTQQFPPPGAFGTAAGEQGQGAAATGDRAASANPFNMLGGIGGDSAQNPFAAALANLGGQGAAGTRASPFGDPALLQQLLGSGMLGGGGSAPGAPSDTRPPEERFATQLEQMQAMGFYDGASNVRALLMSGGSVEGAIGILLDNPNPPAP